MEVIFQSIFKSWKTTITAIVGGAVWLAAQYGIVITPEQSGAVVVVAMMVVGFLSKDADKSHSGKL